MLLMASSYLVYRLTGEYVLDHHSASQCAPMYDLAGTRWRPDWAELVGARASAAASWPGRATWSAR